jgi:hypothetical protein
VVTGDVPLAGVLFSDIGHVIPRDCRRGLLRVSLQRGVVTGDVPLAGIGFGETGRVTP